MTHSPSSRNAQSGLLGPAGGNPPRSLRGFGKHRPPLRGFLDESRYKVPEEPYRCFSWAGDSERTSELSTSQPSPRPRSRTPGATARNLSLQPPGPPRGDGWALTPGTMEIHSTRSLPSDGHRRLARRGQLRICGLRWQGLQKAPTESAFLMGKGVSLRDDTSGTRQWNCCPRRECADIYQWSM